MITTSISGRCALKLAKCLQAVRALPLQIEEQDINVLRLDLALRLFGAFANTGPVAQVMATLRLPRDGAFIVHNQQVQKQRGNG
jgi:hypothetical protein